MNTEPEIEPKKLNTRQKLLVAGLAGVVAAGAVVGVKSMGESNNLQGKDPTQSILCNPLLPDQVRGGSLDDPQFASCDK